MESEIAWAAGLFEGEGHITNRPYTDRLGTQRVLRLRMTDEDVVRRFGEVMGCGQIYGPFTVGRLKPIWDWQCTRWEDIARVLPLMLPWFGARRTAAATALLANPARSVGGQPTDMCGNGHRWADPGVTYISPAGVRSCRPCRLAASRRHRANKKANRENRDRPAGTVVE